MKIQLLNANLASVAAAALILIGSNSFAQRRVQQTPMNFIDPNENFYVTQTRMNKYFEYFQAEQKREQLRSASGNLNKTSGKQEQEIGSYELYKRWEYFMEPRVYPSGDKHMAYKAYEEYQSFMSGNSSSNSSSNKFNSNNNTMSATWQAIGPFGDPSGANAGRVASISFDPTSSTTYWACAPAGGLWKSVNTGSSWTTTTDNLGVIGTSDVIFDPTNAQNVFIATGDGDAGDDPSIGIMKSTNGGATWNTTGLTWTPSQGRTIHKLLINPQNKNTIFAATSIGLLRSQNFGVSWSTMVGGDIVDVEYKPGDTTTVYAASTSFYVSTNGGNTFGAATGLPSSGSVNRLAIAVTPANAAYVYVLAGSAANSGFFGFYQSTNSGSSFVTKATTPNLLGWASAGNDTGGQSWYDLAMDASPTNANEVVVGGVNMWRTTNGGTNWTLFAHWTGTGAPYVHADVHTIKYKNATTLFATSDGGVFFTSNSGTSFAAINGNLNIAQIYKIGNSASTYSRAITGHQDNGTNLFTGGWSGTMGGDGMSCFIDFSNDQVMYGEQYSGSFNRTTDGGATWNVIVTGMSGSAPWNTPWHQHPTTANTLFSGRQQMFKSTNQGTSWAQIGTLPGTSQIREFSICKNNANYIYVIQGNTVAKTTNGGTSWTNITGTLPVGSAQLTWIAVEDKDPNSVWVTFSGYSSGNKVFKTTDGGTTWVNYSTGLPNIPVNCITYWNGTKDGLYIGCDIGVYYRDSLAASWTNYSAGLPNVVISDLAIFYPLGKIRAATYGRAVYEVDLYNNGQLAPIANFTSDKTFLCPGMTVNYTDQSVFGPTYWSWTFQGGTPATSNAQNPSIVYNTPGTYSVVLTATNVNGSSVMTKTTYINVSPTNALPLVEGFEPVAFPPAMWQNYDAASDNLKWTRNGTVGKSSTASLFYDNYNLNASNTRDEMRAPKYSFIGWNNVKMTFDVAYARYDPTYSDTLAVLVSTDCGLTYTQLYSKGGTTLATAPDLTSAIFVPTAAQWRKDTVYLNAYSGQGNVMVVFQNRGRYGQALYIDNINMSGNPVTSAPVASFSYSPSSPCSGQTINFTDLSTNSPTSYTWSFPGGSPATSTLSNPSVTYNTGGNYVATLTSSNSIGQSSPISQTITVVATPTVNVSTATTNICSGNSATLTASGATTYSWIAPSSTLANVVVSPTANTVYTVTGNNGICANTKTISLTVTTTPTVSVNNQTICPGGQATLTAAGAATYSWSTGFNGNPLLASPASNTVYTVIGSNGGCTNTKTVSVTIGSSITIIPSASTQTLCTGGTVNLTATGATTYTWNPGNLNGNSIIITPASSQMYTVTGTAGSCNGLSTIGVTIVTAPALTVTASSSSICTGNTTTLTASGYSSYTWTPGNLITSNISVSPSSTQVYTVVGNLGNCVGNTTKTIQVTTTPTVSVAGPTAVCIGASITIIASGASTYSWNTSQTTNSIVVGPLTPTNYTVTGSNSNCTNSVVKSVSVNPNPTVSISTPSNPICVGDAINLTGNGANTYTWDSGSQFNPIFISPTVTTTYSVIGASAAGCTNTAVFTQSVIACGGVGLGQNVRLVSGLTVYPNPYSDEFIISYYGNTFSYTVYDNVGKLIVSKKAVENEVKVDMSKYAKGIYYLEIYNSSTNEKAVQKLISK
jgi:PKD repeat protein